MSDFSKNPAVPFEIWVPNKIRKRIAMHEKADSKVWKFIRTSMAPTPLRALALLETPALKVPGSGWSRFVGGLRNLLHGERK